MLFKQKSNVNSSFRNVALLISIYFAPEPGGGSGAAWNRAYILHKIGYSVFVITGFPSYPTGKVSDPRYKRKFFYIERMEPFTLIRLRLIPLEYEGYLKRLIIFVNFIFLTIFYLPVILRIIGKVDIVYSMAPQIFSSFGGYVYSKFTRAFFVYEASDLWPDMLIVFSSKLMPIIMIVGKVIAKLCYSTPDIIIAIGDYAAEHIFKNYRPKCSIYPLPIGVDPGRFQPFSKYNSRKELLKKQILPTEIDKKFIILYMGIISSAIQLESLAYAAERLKMLDKEKQIVILIVGEGDSKTKLQQLKVQLNLDNFYLLPFQDRDFVPKIMSCADVCVVSLPSEQIFDVNVPTKFYEYLACRKPFIGICGGETAKIINSYNIGRTVKSGDIAGLVSIISDFKDSPSLIQTMENNSNVLLKKYSLDSLASYFLSILNKEKDSKQTIAGRPF
jgi:glycosyltransferase involved in cell wall biosynthesis